VNIAYGSGGDEREAALGHTRRSAFIVPERLRSESKEPQQGGQGQESKKNPEGTFHRNAAKPV
jgi:hypothetical protein